MHESQPRIDPALQHQVREEPTRKVAAVVTFTQPVSPDELDTLGLYSSDGAASPIGFGELDAAGLVRLQQRSDLAGISGAPVLPARAERAAASAPARSNRIRPDLAIRLERFPSTPQPVIVTFSTPPGTEAMAELGLLEGAPTTGAGSLTAEAVEALAERPDVIEIAWSAPPRIMHLD
jgi:hypothetical protein